LKQSPEPAIEAGSGPFTGTAAPDPRPTMRPPKEALARIVRRLGLDGRVDACFHTETALHSLACRAVDGGRMGRAVRLRASPVHARVRRRTALTSLPLARVAPRRG